MIDESELVPALEEIRSLVQADGGDMLLKSVEEIGGGATVNLQLVVEGASCVECVMPREFLEQIALGLLQESHARGRRRHRRRPRGSTPTSSCPTTDPPKSLPDLSRVPTFSSAWRTFCSEPGRAGEGQGWRGMR